MIAQSNIPQEKIELAEKLSSAVKGTDWLCSACYNKIASEEDRFNYNSKNEFNFTNPQGFNFDIITFSKADGCVSNGEYTNDFSWFPGHSWNYSFCKRCNLHLGWNYDGIKNFFGLIKSRLVKAMTIMN